MNKIDQRIAIAEACGWSKTVASGVWAFGKGDNRMLARFDDLPDYLNDLNAMHEAEKILTPMWDGDTGHAADIYFGYYLQQICGQLDGDDPAGEYYRYETCRATAEQRAKAFLKTLNLWKL